MPDNQLLGSVTVFGVAITQITATQQHAAIVYKDRAINHMSVLHLASHYDLRNEPLKSRYKCVPCEYFDLDELEYFAEHASRIFAKNGESSIPYGFSYSGASVFNSDASFRDQAGAGLTCATFLLAFFEDLGYEILNIDSWKMRPEDIAWQLHIYSVLSSELSPDQVEEMKKAIGDACRYKPEEVVGSIGSYESVPFDFSDAVVIGENLMLEVRAS